MSSTATGTSPGWSAAARSIRISTIPVIGTSGKRSSCYGQPSRWRNTDGRPTPARRRGRSAAATPAAPRRTATLWRRISTFGVDGADRAAGATRRSKATSRPSTHRPAARWASCSRPGRFGVLAAMATASWSRRVSSMKPVRLPTPTCTNTRAPASWSASVSSRNRTGSSRWRSDSVRSSSMSVGYGPARRRRPQRERRRSQRPGPEGAAIRRGRGRRTAASGSPSGTAAPGRGRALRGTDRPPRGSRRSGPHTTDCWGQLSWETTVRSRPAISSRGRPAPQPSAR